MEKKIGKIKMLVEDLDGLGEYIQLDPDELKEMGLKVNDWVKFSINDTRQICFEKATNEEVIQQL